jgi:hypothetical protein
MERLFNQPMLPFVLVGILKTARQRNAALPNLLNGIASMSLSITPSGMKT